MDNLKQTIDKDLLEAVKNKNTEVALTLRTLKSAILNAEINKRPDILTEEDILQVIAKEVKSRKDSIIEFKKGNRNDLVEKEEKQIAIISKYLPPPLSAEEIQKIIQDKIKSLNITSPAQTGLLIKEVIASVKGRADGKIISELVKESLQNIANDQN